ncbi:unnamed protein product, partial [Ectocarpus fasciculatus]
RFFVSPRSIVYERMRRPVITRIIPKSLCGTYASSTSMFRVAKEEVKANGVSLSSLPFSAVLCHTDVSATNARHLSSHTHVWRCTSQSTPEVTTPLWPKTGKILF